MRTVEAQVGNLREDIAVLVDPGAASGGRHKVERIQLAWDAVEPLHAQELAGEVGRRTAWRQSERTVDLLGRLLQLRPSRGSQRFTRLRRGCRPAPEDERPILECADDQPLRAVAVRAREMSLGAEELGHVAVSLALRGGPQEPVGPADLDQEVVQLLREADQPRDAVPQVGPRRGVHKKRRAASVERLLPDRLDEELDLRV